MDGKDLFVVVKCRKRRLDPIAWPLSCKSKIEHLYLQDQVA